MPLVRKLTGAHAMDSAFLPRTQSEETLAWLQPHLSADQPEAAIIAAVETTGTPVYLVDHPRLNAFVWWLCHGKTGFVALNHWRFHLACWLLKRFQPKPLLYNTVGFFWYPSSNISAAMLSYDVHHWRRAMAGETASPYLSRLHDVPALHHQVEQLDETELAALQAAINQELDALTTLRTTLRQIH